MLTIREFVPAADSQDLRQLLPAFLAIWNAPENLRFLSLSQRPFEEAMIRGGFKQRIESGVRYFAALGEGNDILGICVVHPDPIAGFVLSGLGVLPSEQGRGVGRSLISHAIELASSLGFTSVETSVYADNVRMLRLVLSLGFVPARIEYHRRADGADIVVLHRRAYGNLPHVV